MLDISQAKSAAVTDALKELAKLTSQYVVVVAIFILALPTIESNLRTRQAWADLYAWYLVNDFAKSLPLSSATHNPRLDTDVGITGKCGEEVDGFRDSSRSSIPGPWVECPYIYIDRDTPGTFGDVTFERLRIQIEFPNPRQVAVNLYRWIDSSSFILDRAEDNLFRGHRIAIFDLVADSQDIPIDRYFLVEVDNPQQHFMVFRKMDPTALFDLSRSLGTIYRAPVPYKPTTSHDSDMIFRPLEDDILPWEMDDIRVLLSPSGLVTTPADLDTQRSAAMSEIAKSFASPSVISIAGIEVPWLIALVGMPLALFYVCVLMIPPYRILAENGCGSASVWLFASPPVSRSMEWVVRVLGLAITLSPLVVCALQLRTGVLGALRPLLAYTLLPCIIGASVTSAYVLSVIHWMLTKSRSHLSAPLISGRAADLVVRQTSLGTTADGDSAGSTLDT